MEKIRSFELNKNPYLKWMRNAMIGALALVSAPYFLVSAEAHPTSGCYHAHMAGPGKKIRVYKNGRLFRVFTYQYVVLARKSNTPFCRKEINKNNTGPIKYKFVDYWTAKHLYPDNQVKLTRDPRSGNKGHCFSTIDGSGKVFLRSRIANRKEAVKKVKRSRRKSINRVSRSRPVYYVDPCLAAAVGLRVKAGKCGR